jgi:mycoredoxin
MYGATWCQDCRRAKRLLDEHGTPYKWVDIDKDREGEKFVIAANRGSRSIPAIAFGECSILVEAFNTAFSAKLFKTRLI